MDECTCQAIKENMDFKWNPTPQEPHHPDCPQYMNTEEQDVTQPPLITVVVTCFNHGKYLKESVESLFDQTYKNLEIIIVNDGSSDDAKVVAEGLVTQDKRVKFINFEKNMGKWFCLNTAIGSSNGLIVTSQDADDLALPDRIERQFKTLQATESVHTLCGFHHCHSEEDVVKLKGERHQGDLKGIAADVVAQMVEHGFNTNGINHYFTANFETAGTSAMFLKALWNVGFRFNPPGVGLRVTNSEDSDFNVRVTLALRNTTVLAEPLYLYRRFTGTNNESK
jgi:glycosyltransferase involved in cell wall biosynthesis